MGIAVRSSMSATAASAAFFTVTGGAFVVYYAQKAKKTRPLVVTGPSGVGKGTLIGLLLKEYPDQIGFSVSHTTRKPRPGEIDGVHYHFVTKDDMKEMIAKDMFVEHAHVHSNIYGTSKRAVEDVKSKGKMCILDIDVQGAESVKAAKFDARFLFIAPPSIEELEARLRGRGTETEEKIQIRLGNARRELAYTKREGFWDKVLINNDLDAAFVEFKD